MNRRSFVKRILLGFAFAGGFYPFNKGCFVGAPGHRILPTVDWELLPYDFQTNWFGVDGCGVLTEASLREGCPPSETEVA